MSGKTGGWLCLIIHCTYCSTSLGGICANFLCKTTIYGYVKQKLLFSPAECPLAYPRHDDPTSRILVLALTVAHDPLCKLLSDALTLQIPPTSIYGVFHCPHFLGFRPVFYGGKLLRLAFGRPTNAWRVGHSLRCTASAAQYLAPCIVVCLYSPWITSDIGDALKPHIIRQCLPPHSALLISL